MPKERVEVLGRGRSAILDNYQSLTTWAGNRRRVTKAMSVDKGHAVEVARWVESLVRGTPPPIAWDELVNASRATLATIESLAAGRAVDVATG